MDPDNEARRDPRSVFSRQSFTEHDFEGHRALSVYIGFHVPSVRRKSHHRHHHHHHNRKAKEAKNVDYGLDIYKPAGTPPFERVRFILGGDDDEFHEPHPVFSEMEELYYEGKEMEWRETARWVKFEEDVEEGGNRWSKPHIATVSLHSLLVLRNCILNGTVLLDVNAASLEEITDLVISSMVSAGQLTDEQQHKVKEVLLCRHRHLHEFRNEWVDKGSRLHLIKSFAEMGKVPAGHGSYNFPAVDQPATGDKKSLIQLISFTSGGSTFYNREETDDMPPNENVILLSENRLSPTHNEPNTDALSSDIFRRESRSSLSSVPILDKHQLNQGFMRKIPPNAHASNILVGEVDFLERPASAFVRLNQPYHLGDLTEVPLPSKFLFIILGPQNGGYHEVGRALASVMSDEVFHDVAYKARSCQDLLSGIDEFMDAAIVLPAGEWDPAIRIEPPTHVIPQENRLNPDLKDNNNFGSVKAVCDVWKECGLKRTGRLFGGLFNDIRRKAPWYYSDFKDFVALQSIASVIFLYIACLVPVITFGGLLGDATKQRMAVMENLFSAVICGVIYGLFSGQPLTLLGTTGALLVFEGTIFNYCEWWNIDFLSFRLWIGLWTAAILFLFVAFDACVLVCYITRFTEEIFATLISVFFIYKAFENVINIQTKFPMRTRFIPDHVSVCHCDYRMYIGGVKYMNVTAWTREECEKYGSRSVPEGCNYWQPYFVPNVYLLSLILFAGTFALTIMLRKLKASSFFPKKIRTTISDFAVIISIGSMTLLDFNIGLNTPKLDVPQKFKPTWSERDWLIPFFGSNAWWTAICAIIPALVATVLIFMDQEITAIIVNRKENKLKKGGGYHLDLFVLAVLVVVCSLFGLPWNVAATMLSMTHVASLKKVSQCSAPGEKPQVLGVREQRGTHVCIFVLVGLSMFFTPLLKHIPMPVLYGIFLYMGVTSLKGLQFLNRVLILLMPQKYQPDYLFLRHVPVRTVHLFTAIQIVALIILFVIKYFPESALCFPAVLILVIILRRRALVHVFSKAHLKLLDDDMPEYSKRANEENAFKDMYQPHATASTICGVETAKSDFPSTSYDNGDANRCSINLTELILQSGLWKCIEQQSQTTPLLKDKQSQSSFIKKRKDSKKRSSSIQEENENNKNEPQVVECLVHMADNVEYKGVNGTAV